MLQSLFLETYLDGNAHLGYMFCKKKSVLQMPSEPEHIHTQGAQGSKWGMTGYPASLEVLWWCYFLFQGPVSLSFRGEMKSLNSCLNL